MWITKMTYFLLVMIHGSKSRNPAIAIAILFRFFPFSSNNFFSNCVQGVRELCPEYKDIVIC